jgi:hypothetical protein
MYQMKARTIHTDILPTMLTRTKRKIPWKMTDKRMQVLFMCFILAKVDMGWQVRHDVIDFPMTHEHVL